MDENVSVSAPQKSSGLLKKIFAFREASVLVSIIAVMIVLKILSPYFMTKANLTTTALGFAADGIIAIGMTIILIIGGIDLGVGSVMALSMVTVGGLTTIYHVNVWLAVVVAVALSLLCGIFNGFLIGKVKLTPLIATLGMMSMARGGAYVITKGSPFSMSGVPPAFRFLGSGSVFGIPTFVFIFIVMIIISDYLLRRSAPLRNLYYTGSNEKAAELSGINVAKVKLFAYVTCALLSGIAGILTVSRFNVTAPNSGMGSELRVISACVIGGASLTGGEGTVLGSVLGIILLNFINNGLVLMRVSVYWQDLVSGAILIAVVTLDLLSHRKKS
jgi:ribose transport system permease protein